MKIAQTIPKQAQYGPDAASQSTGRVLMQVKGLRKAFGGQRVLDGVDMELREGEVILLRGENGSGKTTLLNILSGNMEPDTGEIQLFVNSHPERFRFPRHWWQDLNPWDHFTPERVANEGVGRTWQDVRLFGSQTLLNNLAVARPNQPGETPWRMLSRPRFCQKAETENQRAVDDLLTKLGLGDRGDSSADMISLGQTKRIAFARSAHANTKIIFLDEPLAGLDRKGTETILAVLRSLAVAHRLTLVIVEHVFNIPTILDFATAVWTLADGHISRETVAEAKDDPAVQNTSALPALIREIAGPDAFITEELLPRGAILTRVSRFGMLREPLLSIKGLVARRGRRLVVGETNNGAVTGFDLTVHKGELVFLQAPNGWGKTSLLEAIAGILPCQSGAVILDGKALHQQSAWERRASGLAVVPARDNVFIRLTVAEYQRISACTARITPSSPVFETPQSSLPNHQFVSSRLISSLSGGERKRLVIANANHQEDKVRIWDEPFTSLDTIAATALCHKLMSDGNSASLILIPSSHTVA
jgi:ABC-type branched-subunit amino acid transport system ATPase component